MKKQKTKNAADKSSTWGQIALSSHQAKQSKGDVPAGLLPLGDGLVVEQAGNQDAEANDSPEYSLFGSEERSSAWTSPEESVDHDGGETVCVPVQWQGKQIQFHCRSNVTHARARTYGFNVVFAMV